MLTQGCDFNRNLCYAAVQGTVCKTANFRNGLYTFRSMSKEGASFMSMHELERNVSFWGSTDVFLRSALN